MPEDKIIIDADVKPLKSQLKGAIQDLQVARQKFGEMSDQAIAAAKKVGAIKDAIQDAGEQAKLFDPGSRFQALTTAASTAAGGVAAVQGAMALFGKESDDVAKTLVKLQGAMALSQGLSQLKDIGKVGDGLISSFKGLTAGANGFKKALISTGIGALVVAVGLLVAYWEDIKGLVGGVTGEQKKLNLASEKNLKSQEDKLAAIDGQTNQLKLQGKSEKEILGLKLKQSKQAILAAEVSLQNAQDTKDAQVKAAERNQIILKGMLNFVSLPLTALLAGIDFIGKKIGKEFGLLEGFKEKTSKLIFNPEQVAANGDQVIDAAKEKLGKLKEQVAGTQLAINAINQTAADRQREINESTINIKGQRTKEQIQLEKVAIEKTNKQIKKGGVVRNALGLAMLEKDKILSDAKINMAKIESESIFNQQRFILDESNRLADEDLFKKRITEEEHTKIKKENADARIKIDQEEFLAKQLMLQAISNALSAASDVVGRETGTGKTLAVAASLMNTYAAITGQLKAFSGVPIPGYAIVQAIATGLAGFAAVRNILKVQVPKGGGGGSVPSMSAPSLSATSIPTLGASPVTAIASVMNRQPPIRAFVVESEVTGTQRRVADIERRAGF